jgi:hypothetical protein
VYRCLGSFEGDPIADGIIGSNFERLQRKT